MDDLRSNYETMLTRRHFFGRTSTGVGIAALAQLLNGDLLADAVTTGGLAGLPRSSCLTTSRCSKNGAAPTCRRPFETGSG